ncbi:exodeoxyribonuclease III [Candidatus Legionella polyplacis]|uniref:Exodeoxyribonuclease III n=1 Tax=Candidatus Legionella polyplacis TaxID=2005262 RepID=A0ABZ2H117_9GAMM
MIKFATWNVNSLKVRLSYVLDWIKFFNIDVLALQETKLQNKNFPEKIFFDLGYYTVFNGQKSYNGVAIISKFPIMNNSVINYKNLGYLGSRLLAVTILDIRIINIYVPNGFNIGSEKFLYKLIWLKDLISFIKSQLCFYSKIIILGDFNIAPGDSDIYDSKRIKDCLLVSKVERNFFFKILSLGFKDIFSLLLKYEQCFSWWDYRFNSFELNKGFRIDHILLSNSLLNICIDFGIDKYLRGLNRPSDHAPVWCVLNYVG